MHRKDYDGVQQHSSGDAYPYVVMLVEDVEIGHTYARILGPGINEEDPILVFDPRQADAWARRLRAAVENEDAWAFMIERAHASASIGSSMIPGVRQRLQEAKADLPFLSLKWAEMTPSQRARSLLLAILARADALGVGPERARAQVLGS